MTLPIKIGFADGAGDSVTHVLDHLIDFTVDLQLTSDGYPSKRVCILSTDNLDNDLVVCETDESGAPERHSTWAIPLDSIREVTVL